MIKKRECFNITNWIKFNDMKIEFQSNETIIIKYASYVKTISSIKNQNFSFINAKNIIRKKKFKKSICNSTSTKCICNFNLSIQNC